MSPPTQNQPPNPWDGSPDVPTGAVGEHDVAVLVIALQEGDTGVLLPVPHGLPEDGSLAACGGGSREGSARRGN